MYRNDFYFSKFLSRFGNTYLTYFFFVVWENEQQNIQTFHAFIDTNLWWSFTLYKYFVKMSRDCNSSCVVFQPPEMKNESCSFNSSN